MARSVGWLSKRPVDDVVGSDIAKARALLPSLRLKLDMGTSLAARTHGEGVEEVGRALATALGAEVTDVLNASTLDPDLIVAATKDIAAAQVRCREYQAAENERARQLARKLDFGCMVFSQLYKMRLHALAADHERGADASAIADGYASLITSLYRGGPGLRQPTDCGAGTDRFPQPPD